MSGLKLTKAAILAFLKKHRKPLQIWEAKNSRTMGITERNYLQRNPSVRAKQGGNRSKTGRRYGAASSGELKVWDAYDGGGAVQGATQRLEAHMAKRRRKVTGAVKKFRKRGGKLSEYKQPNEVYATVRKLRSMLPKGTKKKKEKLTLFNFPR